MPPGGQLVWLTPPGVKLRMVTRSSCRKNSSFQTSGKYVKATKSHLALWCGKSLLWAAAKLKLPQMTRAPARAGELDTDALAWCWPPPWHILAGGRGQLGQPWQPTAPCAVGQKPGLLHQPVLPCPGQGFRAKQLVLRKWCPPLEPLEGFPVTAAWRCEQDVHCLLGKKISWCDGTQEKWCCPPKGMMLVHSKPVLWRGTRHHKGKQIENFLQRCTELSYSAIIKTFVWVAMHHSGGTKVQGS